MSRSNNHSPVNPLDLTPRRTKGIIWTLLCIMPIIGMAVDLVAPSLPAIASGLQITNNTAQGVISIYLLSYAIGNFISGFLTDAFGRRKLLLLNLLGFAIFSLLPIIYPNITCLLITRFLQGLTIGAGSVITRAIFADILSEKEVTHLGTMIATMWGLGPVIGPVLGGYLQESFDWQANFYFFAIIAFICFIAVFLIVPETHFKRQSLHPTVIRKNVAEVLKNHMFIGLVTLMGLAYSLLIIFNTMGPFLIQDKFEHSPVYFGHLALGLGLAFLCATTLCRKLLKTYPLNWLLSLSIKVSTVVAIILLFLSLKFSSSIMLTAIGSGLMYFSCGFIFPMSMGKGLSLFRHIAGTATATMYLINIAISSLSAFLAGFIYITGFASMMWVFFALVIICNIVYWSLIHKHIKS